MNWNFWKRICINSQIDWLSINSSTKTRKKQQQQANQSSQVESSPKNDRVSFCCFWGVNATNCYFARTVMLLTNDCFFCFRWRCLRDSNKFFAGKWIFDFWHLLLLLLHFFSDGRSAINFHAFTQSNHDLLQGTKRKKTRTTKTAQIKR